MLMILLSLFTFTPDPATPPDPMTATKPLVLLAAINYGGYPIHPDQWFTVGLRLKNTSDQRIEVIRMQTDTCSGGMFCRFDSSLATWQKWWQRNLGTCEDYYVSCESEHLAWALAYPNDPPYLDPAGTQWDYLDVGCLTMRAPSQPGTYYIQLRVEPDEWWLSNYPCNYTWVQEYETGQNVLDRVEPDVLVLTVE